MFFLTFDENDGLFDHLPPPAVPSYNPDGTLAGKSTIELAGMYCTQPSLSRSGVQRAERHASATTPTPADTISGPLRPWGLGPRVPMYVVSPWSRGGWVTSEVFDHTSVGRFIEKRFGVTIPAISPWHRAVCGDLTSAFDFEHPNSRRFPTLPDVSNYAQIEAVSKTLPPRRAAGDAAAALSADRHALVARAAVRAERRRAASGKADGVQLQFGNTGQQGAVFHVYDKRHLDRIPRRYTVEAGKTLTTTPGRRAADGGRTT